MIFGLLVFLGCFFGAYFFLKPTYHRQLAPEESGVEAKKTRIRKERKISKGRAITLRSIQILGVDPQKFKLYSMISSFVGFISWMFVSQNIFSAAIMSYLFYQLPGMYYEAKASKSLDQLQKQISTFVGTFNDVFLSGRTVRDALNAAGRSVTEEPMAKYVGSMLRRIAAGENEAVALEMLAQDVGVPSFDFFTDLVKTVRVSGERSNGFQELDWKFREEESLQAETKGEISVYMGFTVVCFLLNPSVILTYRFLMSNVWSYIPSHLSWVTILSAIGSVVIFGGIRKFSRLRVVI